ncbi:MAG: hypothetical protein LBD01_07205 [Puniceicoccales bacterium]|jgi:hypothetical protein|nr:hypothetical protein [Puniceicoccales bacterium]
MKQPPARHLSRTLLYASLYAASLLTQGCDEYAGDKHPAEHAGHDEENNDTLVAHVPGQGLKLAHEVAESLGLQTTTAEMRSINRTITLQAQALDATCAVAAVHGENLADFRPGQLFAINGTATQARLLNISLATQKASGFAELVFELKPALAGNGAPAQLTLSRDMETPNNGVTIPRTALLESSNGNFVYAVANGHYRRTPVQTGGANATHVLLKGGLPAGTTIVTMPVEQLWLAELRLTKGGGHSH